jgi:hypothetical protein
VVWSSRRVKFQTNTDQGAIESGTPFSGIDGGPKALLITAAEKYEGSHPSNTGSNSTCPLLILLPLLLLLPLPLLRRRLCQRGQRCRLRRRLLRRLRLRLRLRRLRRRRRRRLRLRFGGLVGGSSSRSGLRSLYDQGHGGSRLVDVFDSSFARRYYDHRCLVEVQDALENICLDSGRSTARFVVGGRPGHLVH